MFIIGVGIIFAGGWCFFHSFSKCSGTSKEAKAAHDSETNLTAILSIILMAIGGSICGL